eukprot:9458988-Alexandrium_andersonii.AAC.1
MFKQLRSFGVARSSTFGTCKHVPGIRLLKCAGPGMASKTLPEAPEGSTKWPGECAGGVFA